MLGQEKSYKNILSKWVKEEFGENNLYTEHINKIKRNVGIILLEIKKNQNKRVKFPK